MASISIPRNLAADIGREGKRGERRAWLADLPATVAKLSERWSLQVGEPYSPGGSCSWVAPARLGGALGGQRGSPARIASRSRSRRPPAEARSDETPDVVLKVAWAHDEALHEADGLRVWNGAGTVRLLAACHLGQTSALLLERCVPGTALAELKTEYSQDEIVAGLLRRLWIEPAAGVSHRRPAHEPAAGVSRPEADGHRQVEASGGTQSWRESFAGPDREEAIRPLGDRDRAFRPLDDHDRAFRPLDDHDRAFRPLEEMCDRWADAFEDAWERAASGSGVRGVEDPGLARAGVALFRELPRTSSRCVLLCTDLHAENVLAAEREPWLVIDPKPYVGDPAYDVLQHMLNCPGRLHADPRGLARRMARLCELDAERVEAWLLARSVIESIEAPELGHVARALATGTGRVATP